MLKTIRENRKHALPLRIFEVSDVVVKDSREERQARNVRRVGGVFCGRKAGFEVVHGLLDRMMLGLGIQNLVNENNQAEEGYYIKSSDGEFPMTSPRDACGLVPDSEVFVCTDATYFPGRSATIYYRRSKTASSPARLAPAESADPSDASVASASASEPTPVATESSSSHHSGPLDTLKSKLSSALPSVLKKSHEHESTPTAAEPAKPLSRDIAIGSLGILHPSVLKSYELDFPCSALEFDLEPFL